MWRHADAGMVLTGPPGTGSTAVVALLSTIPGFDEVGGKHATATDALGDLSRVGVWTVTRDPWSWWAAEWWRSRHRWAAELDDATSWVQSPSVRRSVLEAVELGFEPWLRRRLVDDRPRALHPAHEAEADHVLRTEHLEQDLSRFLAACGHTPRALAVRNATTGRPADSALHTPWTVDRIARVHGRHAARRGYRPPALSSPARGS